MLKDYYAILGISSKASQKEILDAYRRLSLKWHPDRNPDANTEEQMKDINEAYSILKDEQKRRRYDKEYSNLNINNEGYEEKSNYQSAGSRRYKSYEYEYTVKDENLRNDIHNARKEAEDFVKEFFSNLKADSKKAANGAWKAIKPFLILFAISMGLMLLAAIIAGITGAS